MKVRAIVRSKTYKSYKSFIRDRDYASFADSFYRMCEDMFGPCDCEIEEEET